MARITLPGDVSEWTKVDVNGDVQPADLPTLKADIEVSGMELLRRNFYTLNEKMVLDAVEETRRMAEWLLEKSSVLVPKKELDLFDSRKMDADDDPTGVNGFTVSYGLGGPWYAYLRHEVPAARYTTPGTQHYYLRQPAEELASEFPDIVRERLARTLARVNNGTVVSSSPGTREPSGSATTPLPGAAKPSMAPRLVKKKV